MNDNLQEFLREHAALCAELATDLEKCAASNEHVANVLQPQVSMLLGCVSLTETAALLSQQSVDKSMARRVKEARWGDSRTKEENGILNALLRVYTNGTGINDENVKAKIYDTVKKEIRAFVNGMSERKARSNKQGIDFSVKAGFVLALIAGKDNDKVLSAYAAIIRGEYELLHPAGMEFVKRISDNRVSSRDRVDPRMATTVLGYKMLDTSRNLQPVSDSDVADAKRILGTRFNAATGYR